MSAAKALKAPLLVPGKAAGEVSLSSSVFAVEAKPHLLHQTVRAELAAARQGTRGAKRRGLVAGGRSKPWRQKGTGRARARARPGRRSGRAAASPSRRPCAPSSSRSTARSAGRRWRALSRPMQGAARWQSSTARRSTEPSTKSALALLAGWQHELAAPDRRSARGRGANQELPQPPAHAGDFAHRDRGRGDRLGSLAARQRGLRSRSFRRRRRSASREEGSK